jgi:hypothetical protein
MRLWSIHPRYLDTKGLLSVWREGLLAQKVLQKKTKGYRNHPQLKRFLSSPDGTGSLARYLQEIYQEATRRGYRFAKDKIDATQFMGRIPCTRGQLMYEWEHLRQKMRQRDLKRYVDMQRIQEPEPHPLFDIIEGEVEEWETGAGRGESWK